MQGRYIFTATFTLALLLAQPEPLLDRARRVNLAYASAMPSYIADETAKRSIADPNSTKWRTLDTIQTEITFVGNRAVRRQIRRNGRAWDRPFDALPGFKWYGGFGTEIRPIFDSQCPTTLDYAGPDTTRGTRLLRFRFQSPADACFAFLYFENQQSNPQRTGHVLLDDATGRIVQLDEEATGFPGGFGLFKRTEQVTWANVKIGDAAHLLPVAANFLVVYRSGAQTRIEVEYKNHRHFEASSEITYKP
jgi:hypothetical protein